MPHTRRLSRRRFLAAAAAGTALAASSSFPAPAIASNKREWKMVITYQKALPGLGTGAVRLANRITALSEGAITVKSYGGGELVPPFGVFDAVSEGTAELGFSAPYYWLNKDRSSAFFCCVPGGLTAQEQNAWLYFGGGIPLWHELYAQFGLIAFPTGQTGSQMGGWFKREIQTPEDIKGLKMRIPGLAGEVMAKLGATPQNIAPQELYTSMQSGVIDALEWVGPWNDLALGFHKVSNYYYGPGFHEGGPTLELMINKKAYDALPRELKQILKIAAATENSLMEAEYVAKNQQAMQELRDRHHVAIRTFPESVQRLLYKTAEEVVADTASLGTLNRKIYESFAHFRRQCIRNADVTEYGWMRGRLLNHS